MSQVRSELAFTGLLGLMWLSELAFNLNARDTRLNSLRHSVLSLSTASAEDSVITCDFDGSGDFVESDECTSSLGFGLLYDWVLIDLISNRLD